MSLMLLELLEPAASTVMAAVDPQLAKTRSMFYLMTGLMVVLPIISGVLIYYSLNFPHAQHGHDDH